jgi:predicted transcriptional regulator
MFNEGVDFGNFDITSLQQLLTQVAIRFDNDPNYYNKQDYQYLIWYLCKSLKYLENNDVTKEDFNNIQKSAEELLARIEALEIETDELKD